ncbi:Conserved_hypothetical protein [Hexamita inflata]|uniref:Uncharacterized protein n=1 Tax=Hexamita inflata TaxID=28002 RepID=A0AA86P359_9EUKA|nr:Conserved hypothetical protein [Hexamita inflata]
MQQFSNQNMLAMFERITLVTPPKKFYLSEVQPLLGLKKEQVIKQMRQMIVETLQTQKIISLQSSLNQLVESDVNKKVAELHFFKAAIEIALFKPDVAMDTIQTGLRAKAEPQEMLRDLHQLIAIYMKMSRKDAQYKEIVIRKPKLDPYTKLYSPSIPHLFEIENLMLYSVGGPQVFEQFAHLDESKVLELFGSAQKPAQAPAMEKPKISQRPPAKPVSQQAPVKPVPVKEPPKEIKKQVRQPEQKPAVKPAPKQEVIEQKVESEPSNQLLNYMKQKNIAKRSAPGEIKPEPKQQEELIVDTIIKQAQEILKLEINKEQNEQLNEILLESESEIKKTAVEEKKTVQFQPEMEVFEDLKTDDLQNDVVLDQKDVQNVVLDENQNEEVQIIENEKEEVQIFERKEEIEEVVWGMDAEEIEKVKEKIENNEDDFDEDEAEYQEVLNQSMKMIKSQHVCQEYVNVFEVDKNGQDYLQ